jgi:hypothetical protein
VVFNGDDVEQPFRWYLPGKSYNEPQVTSEPWRAAPYTQVHVVAKARGRSFRTTFDLWKNAQVAGASAEEFIANTVPTFVDRVLKDTPAMLRNRRRIVRGFERRLRKRWGKAFDLYAGTVEVAFEAGSDFNKRNRPLASAEDDFLFEALTRLHARACLTALEIETLLRSGYSEAAHGRWRTLHELAVVANILVERGQSNDLAERFLLHERAESAWDAGSFQRHATALGYEPLMQAEIDQLDRVRDELARRFGADFPRPYGWAAILVAPERPTFSKLEELAGMAHMQPWYKLTSHAVRAGSKGAALGVKKRGAHQFMMAGPSNIDLADPGHGALIALTQVTICLLLRTRVDSIPEEPLRILVAKTLLELTDKAGDAFLTAHQKLERDEALLWAATSEDTDKLREDLAPDTSEGAPHSSREQLVHRVHLRL